MDQSALSIYLRQSNLFHSKRPKIVFQDQLSLNEGQKYTFDLNKAPVVIKTFVLSIFEWPLTTGFTVLHIVLLCFAVFYFCDFRLQRKEHQIKIGHKKEFKNV